MNSPRKLVLCVKQLESSFRFGANPDSPQYVGARSLAPDQKTAAVVVDDFLVVQLAPRTRATYATTCLGFLRGVVELVADLAEDPS
jgi:hypothetical protein